MKQSGTKTDLRRGRVEVRPKGAETKADEQALLLDELFTAPESAPVAKPEKPRQPEPP